MRLLHVSDLHFGRSSVPAQVEALEAFIARESLDAIVISGDLSQRTRRSEFERAAVFVRRCESRAPTVVVPGNHDCAWWTGMLGAGGFYSMFNRYREYIRSDIEPQVRVEGATIVGLNSAHGIQTYTLTTRPRDLTVVGAVLRGQWARARTAFAMAPPGDLRVLVVHHNVLRGKLSNRWGLASREFGLVDIAHSGADLVCCGHDHEERIEGVSAGRRHIVVSTAGTMTDRTRGGRPGSWNLIDADAKQVSVALYEWQPAGAFMRSRTSTFARRTS
ncbi:MAG: metallophosphoesterase [Gemmatimonadetes bacterium]|nr:metallophosphoesterase [Gemmatimonadota bacterium]